MPDSDRLRSRVVASLREQGFRISNGEISLPHCTSKDTLRRLHESAVAEKRRKAESSLKRVEPQLLRRIANGDDVRPQKIIPRLVEVQRGTEDELLFRWAYLHWSIPVSAGYGRRLRYLVVDEPSSALIGIIGLGDPVFSLGPRDEWIGWSSEARKANLRHVIDAFVLGAVPPFSSLLGGKLVAMLAMSREVMDRWQEKYSGRSSVIAGREHSGKVAVVTTLSALGRSSIYNRLKGRDGRLLLQPLGMTRGSGEFHFSNGLYAELREFAEQECEPTAKAEKWGAGFRNRREVIKKALPRLGLSWRWIFHGVEREVYGGSVAANARPFLRGKAKELEPSALQAGELFDWFRERWLLPRSLRSEKHRLFRRSSYAIWGDDGSAT